MALIFGYEYDIFISYAHLDNEILPGQAEGWIQQFYHNLNLMLAKRYGRMDTIKIWWDSKKLDGSVLFDNSIEEGIKKSAIMICLNSPGYMRSDYCKSELNLFYTKAKSEKMGLEVAHRSRIINVMLNNIPFSDWPNELSGSSGFPFHDSKETDDFGNTLETSSTDFRTQMHNLRDAVWQLLTQFPTQVESEAIKLKAEQAVDKEGFKVFLGEVADTLRVPRKRIITELEKKGYQVIDGIPPPYEAVAHEKATKVALQRSDLAVHLLDEYPGREIEGQAELWYPQKQTEIALSTDLPQLIWMPSSVELTAIEGDNYKFFIKSLDCGKAAKKSYEFIQSSKCSISQQIIAYAEQLKEQKVQKIVKTETVSVLLDTHFKDQLYAYNLSKVLLENQIQPFINPQEDDPRKNINLLGDRMAQVRKLIFLYGNVSKEWLLERMSAALQLIIVNNYPIENFYIYMAPPHKEKGEVLINQRFLKVNVFDNSRTDDLDEQTLKNFLTDLKMEVL